VKIAIMGVEEAKPLAIGSVYRLTLHRSAFIILQKTLIIRQILPAPYHFVLQLIYKNKKTKISLIKLKLGFR